MKLKALLLLAALSFGIGSASLWMQAQATVNEVDPAANRYPANGTTTAFVYTFKIYSKQDIEVLVDATTKTVDIDYVVSGVGESLGGTVTFLAPPDSGTTVTLLRKQPASQLSTYTSEAFPPRRVERDFDKLAMAYQQVKEHLSRTLAFNKYSQSSGILDEPIVGKYARWKSGGGIEWVDAINPVTVAQNTTDIWVQVVGGTGDAITLSPSPALANYTAGVTYRFAATGTNTGAVTVNVSGLGAKALTKNGTTALIAGDIPSGTIVEIVYDGTRFILGHPGVATIPAGVLTTGPVVSSGLTMSTARLLGRTTASTGAIEELTAGTGLSLTGGSLSVTAASESAAGAIELATQGEVNTMADTTRALTPNHNKLVMGTMVALSGTSVDFTSIPSGVRRITGTLSGMSTNGTSNYMVQLGDSGGVETSGYLGSASTGTTDGVLTTGCALAGATAAASVAHGSFTLTLMDAATNLWVGTSQLGYSNAAGTSHGGCSKALSATLDRIRLTTVGGVNTFDAGNLNIVYER